MWKPDIEKWWQDNWIKKTTTNNYKNLIGIDVFISQALFLSQNDMYTQKAQKRRQHQLQLDME